MSKVQEKIYFSNLDGVRFIAAAMVVFHHIEQMKDEFKIVNFWDTAFIQGLGHLGVLLFFVLSGFLITYLLLDEKKIMGDISIKKFYIRRILRIWPLYFLIVFLGFFIYPTIAFLNYGELTNLISKDFNIKLSLFVFLLPQLALFLFPPIPFVAQAWSIGVEEQFYLIWPLLVKKIKRVPFVLVLIIIFGIFFRIYFRKQGYGGTLGYMLNINGMAVGGLGAYIYFAEKQKILDLLYKKKIQFLVYLLLIVMIIKGTWIPFINDEIYATIFVICVINLAGNKGSIISLKNKILKYLGKISFGLYMYHGIAIFLTLKIISKNNMPLWVIYPFVFVIAITIAGISYELFEKRFIILKKKYSNVLSGENAK